MSTSSGTAGKGSGVSQDWKSFPWLGFAYGELMHRVARFGSVDTGNHNVHAFDKEGHVMNNPRILEYFDATSWQPNDETKAWCSAFVNWCISQAGFKGTRLANARSWLDWKSGVKLGKFNPTVGAVAVFPRGHKPTEGHVAFVWKVYADGSFDILGGNQGGHGANAKRHTHATSSHVSIARGGAALDFLWPKSFPLPGTNTANFIDYMSRAVPADLKPPQHARIHLQDGEIRNTNHMVA